MVVELYEHQQKAVDKMHNGCILWGGVGTGKSLTALAYFVSKVCKGTYGDFGSMRTPRDIYIITTAKKRDSLDWEKEAIKFGISTHTDNSIEHIKLTVDSWNNIEDYLDVKDAFFIFDEQRVVGSGSWAQTFIKIAKRNEWILLSATPGDTWLDYIPVFVANGWYKNRTEFKRTHVVYNTFTKFPKVDRYVETGRLVRYRNKILVHMPYERHTVRHNETISVDYDIDLFNKVVNDRWHVYEQRPLKGVAELFLVMRKVVNSDKSRLEAVRTLSMAHPKLIVFYNFDYELEMLRTLCPTITSPSDETISTSKPLEKSSTLEESLITGGHWTEDLPESLTKFEFESSSEKSISELCESKTKKPSLENSLKSFEIAEWNGHKHEPIPKSERWIYLVQYTAGSEGWNCIETNAMVFFSLTYSYKAFHQAHGRIDRLNTPFKDLWYYTLFSNSLIDQAIFKSLKQKKSFNESNLPL